ncbi:hypothetical protein ACLB2K_059825 [Fragaria x ananassa]
MRRALLLWPTLNANAAPFHYNSVAVHLGHLLDPKQLLPTMAGVAPLAHLNANAAPFHYNPTGAHPGHLPEGCGALCGGAALTRSKAGSGDFVDMYTK